MATCKALTGLAVTGLISLASLLKKTTALQTGARCDALALRAERRIEVAGSTLAGHCWRNNLRKVVHTLVPLSPTSI